MKKQFLLKNLILLIMLVGIPANIFSKDVIGDWNVIPQPLSVVNNTNAKCFAFNGDITIVNASNKLKINDIANLFMEYMKGGKAKFTLSNKASKGKNIVLQLSSKIKNKEGYKIVSDENKISITAATEASLFYGVQTLQKALPIVEGQNDVQLLPSTVVIDEPRFRYRAFMIDVGRHFFTTTYLKKLINVMSQHNMNYFHLHLTEDQGWRVEIKKYPNLTKVGSVRENTLISKDPEIYEGKENKGFYTQDELRDLVKYASERFITIIPEVDLPGHMMAALASYPNLGCTGGDYKVPTNWGVFKDVLCAGNPDSYTFVKDVLSEIMDIFPSEYIHIGGDECPKAKWCECPKCQAKIKELGLKDTPQHTKENQLQSYFMSTINDFIMSKGRKMLGWDEIVDGGLFPNSTIISWRGIKGGLEAARQHHDVVMAPINFLYLSNPGSNKSRGLSSVKKVYTFEPASDLLTESEKKYIIGAEGCIWTEWVRDSVKMEWSMFPRLAALAEVQWTAKSNKDYDKFLSHLSHQLKLYKKQGVIYKEDINEVDITTAPAENGALIVTMKTYDDAPIYFTVDAMDPSSASFKYTKPFKITGRPYIRAAACRNGVMSGTTTINYK